MESDESPRQVDPADEGGEPACSMHLVDDYLEPLPGSTASTPTDADADADADSDPDDGSRRRRT